MSAKDIPAADIVELLKLMDYRRREIIRSKIIIDSNTKTSFVTIGGNMPNNDDYLSDLCEFGGPEAVLPTQIYIAAGVGILDLIKALVIKNPTGAGILSVPWEPTQPIPEKVIGIIADMDTVNYIQSKNNGRGILLKSPNIDTWMTLDEWGAQFNTNGLGLIARMRLDWNKTGGGVHIGRPISQKKEFKKLGGN
jgi:hypothetical protein